MTASNLKYLYRNAEPNGHFFDYQTMQFFGDTMKNFGVYQTSVEFPKGHSRYGERVNAYCLYRKHKTAKGASEGFLHAFSLDGKELIGAFPE